MKRLLPLLLLLVLAGCSRKPAAPVADIQPHPTADSQLRGFLGVHTFEGEYVLPPGDDYYLVTPLEIEDGKIVRRGLILSSVEPAKNRKLNVQFLWGEVNGKMKETIWFDGTSASGESDFWKVFEQGCGSRSFTNGEKPPVFEGYVILGFVSSPLARDGKSNPAFSPDFAFEVRTKKHVGALAVKPFKTEEELKQNRNAR